MIGLWIGKLLAWLLRLLGRRATSLPGKIALRLSPNLLARLGRQLNFCAIVTGTNGKTTTTALLCRMFEADGPIVHNAEGANMRQGILTALLQNARWTGRLRVRTGVFEVDEATLPLVASVLPVRVAVVTNLFRDQLDRYGELDTTVQKVLSGLQATRASLVLNGDDPLCRYIGLECGQHHVLYFGMDNAHARTQDRDVMRDGAFCLRCGHPLRYDGFFYGQLGRYVCTQCDFVRPHPDFLGQYDGRTLTVQQNTLPAMPFTLPVRGIFNVYNALAAVAAARVSGLTAAQIRDGLANFQPPVGRMQLFPTQPAAVLNLIKNPAGCDSVLAAIANEPGEKCLCILINDLAADGRDVSWLWDADFELIPDRIRPAFCVTGGLRTEDMAVRLKYAGTPVELITVAQGIEPAIDQALAMAKQAGGIPVYVLATYTALYPAAEHLRRRAGHPEPPVPEEHPADSGDVPPLHSEGGNSCASPADRPSVSGTAEPVRR